ncbi:MAG: lipopolysaccharide export system protein LptA [Variibacter sp.]|jgi:lipopolysaccharide export system protein LptA|nr:lipopolysaccharide export system protein LptA [Variibacter sp.]
MMCFRGAVFAVALLSPLAPAGAQVGGQPNALQGFSKNQGQPIQIESATLEVREKDKQATFTDNVKVVQGDTTLECKTLVVHYDGETQATGAAPRPRRTQGPASGGQQQIKRLEAKGGVVVTQKDQTATGDRGIYDLKANTVTLIGNVVVTQSQNVLRGDRLVHDMGTGVSRMESASGGPTRVQGLFSPGARETKPSEVTGTVTPHPAPPTPRTATSGGEREKPKPAAKPRS